MNTDNKSEATQNNIELNLYDKEVRCPVCGCTFHTPVVKSTSYRIKSKSSDLYTEYSLLNPYFYDVWLCEECGYAALKSDFEKIKKHQTQIILQQISPKWKRRNYPKILDIDAAIERYKLALLTSTVMESKFSVKAMTCLKLAWMYRIKEDAEHEQIFLKQALAQFKEAYFKEDFPLYGMDRFTTMYLIGELHRRTGDNKEALLQFSSVITSPGVNRKVKDLAIAQKDLIKAEEQKKEEEEEAAKAIEEENSNSDQENKKKGFFARLFG